MLHHINTEPGNQLVTAEGCLGGSTGLNMALVEFILIDIKFVVDSLLHLTDIEFVAEIADGWE